MESRGESELQQLVSSDGDCDNEDSIVQDDISDYNITEIKVMSPVRSNKVSSSGNTSHSSRSHKAVKKNTNTTNSSILYVNEKRPTKEPAKSNTVRPRNLHKDLDHTADVQIHGWGSTLQEAFEQCGVAMFGYMTELPTVEIKQTAEVEATGHDMESLLYNYMNELLYVFCCEPYLICSKVEITEFDREAFSIKATCYGEEFEIGKHPQGTEVKAITYSMMQIVEQPEKNNYEVFVIIDI